MLSQEAIEEFIEIYEETYGVKLSYKDALDKAVRFITMIKAIYMPIPVVEGPGVSGT